MLVRITKTIGLNNDTMYNIFMNQDKINYIISNFNDYRCQDLANYLNEPYQAVRYQIRKLKLHKTKHQLVRTKSSFNNHYFDKLNKDNSYFLGLIWADGHIKKFTENSYQFEIGLVDEDLIKSFAKELNTKYSLLNNKRINEKPIYRIRLNNKHFGERLSQLGYANKKIDRDYLPSIPKEYMLDFIRGYFDGDGTVYIKKTKNTKGTIGCRIISPCKNVVIEIKNYLKIGKILEINRKNLKTLYALQFYKDDSILFFKKIYTEGTKYKLDRKYNIFIKMSDSA